MAIKYQCCYCHEIFPAEKQVDWLDQGCKTGFLCPNCGRNIRDDVLTSRQRLDDCQKKWLRRMVWLFAAVLLSSLFDRTLVLAGQDIGLDTVATALFVVSGALVLVFVPCTRKAGVFITEPVEKQ